MRKLTLVYEKDPNGKLPRLRAPSCVTEAERKDLDKELRESYDDLVHLRKDRICLKTPLSCLPGSQAPGFQVSLRRGLDGRLPTVVLEHPPSDPLAASDGSSSDAADDWPRGLLADLERLYVADAEVISETPEKVNLAYTVAEFSSLSQRHPHILAPLLLAGYLALAGRACKGRDQGRVGAYVLAARVVEEFFRSMLPEEVMHTKSSETVFHKVKLYWSAEYLGWALGVAREAESSLL